MKINIKKIGIVGAGAWGSALAISIVNSGIESLIWAREEAVVKSINEKRENTKYLPNILLPNLLTATNNLQDLSNCDLLFIVCPAQFTRNILLQIKEKNFPEMPFIFCSKGIEQTSLMLQSEIAQEILGNCPLGILSGPTFADEVAALLPAALNFASNDSQLSESFKDAFTINNLSIHLNEDIIGTQIGGIVKNVIAIGCGIAAGLNLGHNMHAALITQGLKEAALLSKAKKGKENSLLDFCGVGDMFLTCSSIKSRNFSFGIEIAKGSKIKDILVESNKVIEGYASAKPLFELVEKLKIELPLCTLIYKILYEEQDPKLISAAL